MPLISHRSIAAMGLLAAGAMAATPAAAWTTRSTTWIPAGQTFVLGGGQPAAFVVEGRNTGPVPVTISAGMDGGPRAFVATVQPGATVKHRFAPGETAWLANGSPTQRAEMTLQLKNVSGLRMTYTPN